MNIKFRFWKQSLNKFKTAPQEFIDSGRCAHLCMKMEQDKFCAFILKSSEGHVYQQYIGLEDKNGNSIYEGDILSRYDGEEILEVQYCQEYAKFGGLIHLQNGRAPENDCWYWFDDPLAHVSEVIGNIFENPELLDTK